MRRILAVLTVAAGLGLGTAQQVGVGLEVRTPAFTVAPTLDATYALGDWTLDGWVRVPVTEVAGTSLGLGAAYALEHGPAGRITASGKGFWVPASGDYWAEGALGAALGPVALDLKGGYSTAPRQAFWPGESARAGAYAEASGKYRLSRKETLAARVRYQENQVDGEAALVWRAGRTSRTLGLGWVPQAPYLYAVAGWKGRVERALVDLTLRAGGRNELVLKYFTREARGAFTLAYPWAAILEMTWQGYWVRAEGNADGYGVWGGYRFDLDLGGLR